MASNEELIRNVLSADATLIGLLTGGFYAYSDTTRSGFSRIVTPSAYDSITGLLLPLVVVKERVTTIRQGIVDESAGYNTTRQVIEIWLYDDGDRGYSTVQQARDRVYSLLQNQAIGNNVFQLLWIQDSNNLRDKELNEASLIKSDFALIGFKAA